MAKLCPEGKAAAKRKKMAKGGVARGCGAIMPNRKKVTKVY